MDKLNYKQKNIKEKLEKLHFTDQLTNRNKTWSKEKKRHESIIKKIQKQNKWRLLTGIANGINAGSYGNLFPDYLLKLYAPLFFKKYPDGKIWFIPFSIAGMHHFLIEGNKLTKKYKPDLHSLGFSQSYGIDFHDTLISIGLEIPMFVRFPYFQGSITGSMSGIVCFVINSPMSMYDDNWNLHGFLMDKTKGYYTDSNWQPFKNTRSIFNPLSSKIFSKYFKWYVDSLNRLYDFVLNLSDLETKRLVSFSLARICLDTYLIQIIEQPYLRKILFLTLLDKYANFVHDFCSTKSETDIWKNLLSLTFFEHKLKPIVKKTPRSMQILQGMRFTLKHTVRHVLYSKHNTRINIKSHENEVAEYLRVYRNSHHGYLLNDKKKRIKFLDHTGEIPNYLPDLSLDLWHTFLANPQEFVDSFK
ncbi:hypothetical protein [Candidatus Nitrosotalea bavarica]|uniref:hypothetical protein n=1 Tax=Candidatus Nitrosotalea bavarica TaxID=1903277 RepID=UPI000C70E446|nr:hypothetical protein [Candidatus Nitrosotalea bavarica]